MSYQKVIDTLREVELSWDEIDRIHLSKENYQEFQERASFPVSNRSTNERPAVRETLGDEKIIYVDDNGMEVSILL